MSNRFTYRLTSKKLIEKRAKNPNKENLSPLQCDQISPPLRNGNKLGPF